MSTEIKKQSVKSLLASDDINNRLKDILGRNAATFATSVIQLTTQNKMLADCTPMSVVGAAITAATLNLPLNQNLGYAYVVPYNEKQSNGNYEKKAQFQLGYKGFIQLAQRSGQFKTINCTDVKEGEIMQRDRLSGSMDFEWLTDEERQNLKTIGYVAYFKLLNGYEATFYMSVDDLNVHGKKFSKTYDKQYGLWKKDFDSMASKTVLKLLLSKFAPLSIDMQKAVTADQALINDLDGNDVTYLDNENVLDVDAVSEAKEEQRILDYIQQTDDVKVLKDEVEPFIVTDKCREAYDKKLKELSK